MRHRSSEPADLVNASMKRGEIKVWRVPSIEGVELRQGRSVTAPYPKHWHEEYQLCLVNSGAGHVTYRGADHATPADSLFVGHPGEVHSNEACGDEGCSFQSLYIEPGLVTSANEELGGLRETAPFFRGAVLGDELLLQRFNELFDALNVAESRLIRDSALLSLLTLLLRRFSEDQPRPQPRYRERRVVGLLKGYLTENYARNVSLAELSSIAGLSAFHLNRVFREATGVPPHAFQTQVRISRAKGLLREGWSIADVAAATGFSDQSHLTRHFKRLMAITPARYCPDSKNVQDASGQPSLV